MMMEEKHFVELMSKKKEPSVIELGSRRSHPEKSTMHKDWVPHAKEYIGADFMEGIDVDVVCDAHFLSEQFGYERFDAVLACAVFEHIQYPWIVVPEINRILKPGGLAFIQAPNAFPIHAYPFDYWRFTVESLITLFGEQSGFRCIDADYNFPAAVVSTDQPGSEEHPAFLMISFLAEKIRSIPVDFRYIPEKYYVKRNENCDKGILKTDENVQKAVQQWLLKMATSGKPNNDILKFRRLRKHWFFGPMVRLANHFINADLKNK